MVAVLLHVLLPLQVVPAVMAVELLSHGAYFIAGRTCGGPTGGTKSQGLGWSVPEGLQGGHPGTQATGTSPRHPQQKHPAMSPWHPEAVGRGRLVSEGRAGMGQAGEGRLVYTKGHAALGRVSRWQLVGSPFTGTRCPDPH